MQKYISHYYLLRRDTSLSGASVCIVKFAQSIPCVTTRYFALKTHSPQKISNLIKFISAKNFPKYFQFFHVNFWLTQYPSYYSQQ